MDFTVMNKSISVAETLFDDFDERPVDCDFVLPDYCPDIAGVLKCTLKPVVQSKQWSGDRLLADGQSLIRVLYLDEARSCVRCCEFTQPFTSTFNIGSANAGTCVQLTARTDYVNCRATSPRRLDVHGAFTVKLKITAEGGQDVIGGVEGGGVHTRTQKLSSSVPATCTEKNFTINEVLDLGSGKAPAEALIRSDAVPVLTDCKLLAGKAILKGNVLLKNLYTSDIAAGTMEQVRHEIPFSQIVDVEGLCDDWKCEVALEILSSEVHISVNQNGESCLLTVTLKMMAALQCTRTSMMEIVTDAYSTLCPLTLETAPLHTQHLQHVRRETCVVKEALELPEGGISAVVDVWGEVFPAVTRCEEEMAFVDGRLLIAMLARDNDGAIAYYERPAEFVLDFEEHCDAMTAQLTVLQIEYTLMGDKVELRIEICVSRACYGENSCQGATSLLMDENAQFPPEKAALKIYFADGGESIWEIAKSCHTSMQAVMDENNLPGETVPEDTMLLVPLC